MTNITSMMSENINELALALSKAQAAIENVGKDKQGYGYKYADLASCLEAIKKPFSDNGLSVSQLITQNEDKQILATLIIHSSGQWLRSDFSIEPVTMKQGNSLQHFGAGLTYARRYALAAAVCLAQEDDDAASVNTSKGENIKQTANELEKFMALCRENSIDAKAFTKLHNIDSKNIETVRTGIANFEVLKQRYFEVSNANIQGH